MAAPTSTSYTPQERRDTVDAVCALIEDGALSADACNQVGISMSALRRWCREQPELEQAYTRARSIAADALAEQAVSIAQGKPDADGRYYHDPQERRLAYDALRWLAGKRRPSEYGDKQQVEHTGSIGHLHLAALQAPRATTTAKLASHNDIAQLASDTEHTPHTGDVRDE